ncbi:MAG: protein kinase domain-containing protein, partial [Gemmataceae bacterium]
IFGEIGRGGMGVVYKARQNRLDRLVAIKMLRAETAAPEERVRFRTEAESMASLVHPGIVQIYEVGEWEGQPYLVLEYAARGTLEERLRERPLAPAQAAHLIRRLALAIQHAHDQGILHRDLKPSNILIGSDDYAKITDFGLAKKLDSAISQTLAGEVIGTPSYMAPEQAEGKKSIGRSVDIYSLGAILYECLTGRPPFLAGSVLETLEQVRHHDPVTPRSLCPAVPRDLEVICLKCLGKTPGRRYDSAKALADDLGRFLDGLPIQARPVGPVERSLKWARRNPGSAVLVLASLLLALFLAAAVPLHIVQLRVQYEQIKAALEKTHEEKRRSELNASCERRMAEGQQALSRGQIRDVERAIGYFAAAEESINDQDDFDDPQLHQLREKARTLRSKASGELARLLGSGAARARARRFLLLRDEVFLHLYQEQLGLPSFPRPRSSLDTCLLALEVFPELDSLNPEEQDRLRTARLEVLLLVAEASARLDTDPDHLRRALRHLDELGQEPSLGHGLHLRRARYQEWMGRGELANQLRQQAREVAPTSAMDWFLSGQERWLGGDPRGAISDLDRAITLNPDLFWARFLRAAALKRTGHIAEARAELGQCIRSRPDFAWSYLLRAGMAIELGQPNMVGSDLDVASRLGLDESARYTLWIMRGKWCMARKEPRLALMEYQRAFLWWPRQPQAASLMAQTLRELGDRHRALAMLDHAIQLGPDQADLYRQRARTLAEVGDTQDALRDANRVQELELRNDKPVGSHTSTDHLERARLLHKLRKYPEALSGCDACLQLNSTHPEGLLLRAETLLQMGRFAESVEAFNRYMSRAKPDAEVLRHRGLARGGVGDFSGAVEDYTKALMLAPSADLFTSRGWVHLQEKLPRHALKDFDEALRLEPLQAEALIGRATAWLDLGDLLRAQKEVDAGLERQPTCSRVLYKAARVLARLANQPGLHFNEGPRQRALVVLKQAIEAVPDSERERFVQEQVRRDQVFQTWSRRGDLDLLLTGKPTGGGFRGPVGLIP